MAKNRKSELERLEEALLAEEETEEAYDEEYEIDRQFAELDRNYRVYNTDTADMDLDAYSDDVYDGGPSRRTGFWVALLLISLLALGFLGGWLLRYLGVL